MSILLEAIYNAEEEGAELFTTLQAAESAGVDYAAAKRTMRALYEARPPCVVGMSTATFNSGRRNSWGPSPDSGTGDYLDLGLTERGRREIGQWPPGPAEAFIAATGYALAPDPPSPPLEAVAVRPGPGIAAEADVIPHTWGMEIRLTAAGFDTGAAYRVVVLDDTGHRVDAGAFLGTGADEMVCNLNSSVARDDARGFEVIAPDGDVVLTSAI